MTKVPASGPNPQGWRPGGAGGPAGTAAKTSRGQKLFWSLAALLALFGAVVALLLYLSGVAAPDFIDLAVREYGEKGTTTLACNSQAYQDSILLAKRLGHGDVAKPYGNLESDAILRAFPKEDAKPVVVYLNALGRYRNGQVYLLGQDADPDREDTWLPLAEVLKKMRACQAPGKLLILDIMSNGADSRLGFFTDGIAAQVQEMLTKEKNLPFYVLCACSADQVSIISEELGHSLFAYYLDLGLSGCADGYGRHGKADKRITVTELAEYVKGHVDRLAWESRGLRQTPGLFGASEDFAVVQIEDTGGEPNEAPAAAAYPGWLREGWKLRDKWRADIGWLGPGIVRNADAALLRAELRWRGGMDEPRVKDESRLEKEWLSAKQDLEIQVQRIMDSRPNPLPRSLPLIADNQKTTAALVDSLRPLLVKALDPNIKIDDKKAEEKTKKEAYDTEVKGVQAVLNKQPLDAAQALVEAAAGIAKLEPPQIILANQLLQNLPSQNRYDQTVFLERLLAFESAVRNNDWDWPMVEVQQALKTMRASENVLAALAQDPALLPWVADALKKADDLRRSGDKRLFGGLVEPMAWMKASQELKEAEAQYADIQIRTQALHKARVVYDRAYGLLPSLGPILLARPNISTALAKTWKDAVQAASLLADGLARPSAGGDAGAALEIVSGLNQNLDDLERAQERKVKRRRSQGEDGVGEEYLEGQALLDSAWLDGPRREAVWAADQKLGLRLFARVQSQDKAEPIGQPQSLAPPGTGQGVDPGAAKKWRWRQAIDMLQLAGSPDVNSLDKQYQSALTNNQDEAWSKLEDKISGLWPQQPLNDYKKAEGNWVRADRLVRLLSPFDLANVRSTQPAHWSQNPTLALYRKDLAAFWRSLAKRFQLDSDAQEEGSPFRNVYREFAEKYADLASAL